MWDCVVEEFIGEEKLKSLRLRNIKNNETSELAVDGVFVAIGHKPSTEVFTNQIELDEKGYIKRIPNDKFQMASSISGVFVAGDVHDYHYRQAVTAAGYGCMAALEVLKYLEELKPQN